MKKWVGLFLVSILFLVLFSNSSWAQCSICTKTASQLGEKPAAALNSAILYLMGTPFVIVGFIAWRWWKGQKEEQEG